MHCNTSAATHTATHTWTVNTFAAGRLSQSVCCSVSQCVAVCCSVCQWVAVCCSVLQCVAVCRSVSQCVVVCRSVLQCVEVSCSVSQCVAVCRSVSQRVTVCCSLSQRVVVCCSVSQCVTVCCSVLQCVAVCRSVSQCVAVWHSVSQRVAVFLSEKLFVFLSEKYIKTSTSHSHIRRELFYTRMLSFRGEGVSILSSTTVKDKRKNECFKKWVFRRMIVSKNECFEKWEFRPVFNQKQTRVFSTTQHQSSIKGKRKKVRAVSGGPIPLSHSNSWSVGKPPREPHFCSAVKHRVPDSSCYFPRLRCTVSGSTYVLQGEAWQWNTSVPMHSVLEWVNDG